MENASGEGLKSVSGSYIGAGDTYPNDAKSCNTGINYPYFIQDGNIIVGWNRYNMNTNYYFIYSTDGGNTFTLYKGIYTGMSYFRIAGVLINDNSVIIYGDDSQSNYKTLIYKFTLDFSSYTSYALDGYFQISRLAYNNTLNKYILIGYNSGYGYTTSSDLSNWSNFIRLPGSINTYDHINILDNYIIYYAHNDSYYRLYSYNIITNENTEIFNFGVSQINFKSSAIFNGRYYLLQGNSVVVSSDGISFNKYTNPINDTSSGESYLCVAYDRLVIGNGLSSPTNTNSYVMFADDEWSAIPRISTYYSGSYYYGQFSGFKMSDGTYKLFNSCYYSGYITTDTITKCSFTYTNLDTIKVLEFNSEPKLLMVKIHHDLNNYYYEGSWIPSSDSIELRYMSSGSSSTINTGYISANCKVDGNNLILYNGLDSAYNVFDSKKMTVSYLAICKS